MLIWLATLPIPVTYHVPRGQAEGYWITIGEHYFSYSVKLLPSIFTQAFVDTLPFSLVFIIVFTGLLFLHVLLCALIANLFVRTRLIKKVKNGNGGKNA
ncbi:MAG: hypothetical protein CSH37_12365 [Thalassolituus sp.]|nr:MAG: hypothetical protein CSH37_12365 [Thalassolituus sp.]